jgi:hypothetical protein
LPELELAQEYGEDLLDFMKNYEKLQKQDFWLKIMVQGHA